jgi:transcription elongation factor GreA-like protein
MESTVILASWIIKASSLMETSSARNADSQSAPLEVLKLKLELVEEVLVLSLREELASIASSAVTDAVLDSIVALFVDGIWVVSTRLLQDRTFVLRGFFRLFMRALCSMLSYSS